ncbi:SUN domain-containing protein 2-like isoform X2 [Cuculus canorus]|uniref:SUN domain-containing protein 2-like isoform X2 n=1 Tax=Cuculus canorus TaxID=55661 RepID=UPI0023AA8B92|nr:SUN domain-containing protein 2-like isoform X2 [Cuculus canorus]
MVLCGMEPSGRCWRRASRWWRSRSEWELLEGLVSHQDAGLKEDLHCHDQPPPGGGTVPSIGQSVPVAVLGGAAGLVFQQEDLQVKLQTLDALKLKILVKVLEDQRQLARDTQASIGMALRQGVAEEQAHLIVGQALKPNIEDCVGMVIPENCWAFCGSQGFAIVHLSSIICVTAMTIQHIPKALSLQGTMPRAAKDFADCRRACGQTRERNRGCSGWMPWRRVQEGRARKLCIWLWGALGGGSLP